MSAPDGEPPEPGEDAVSEHASLRDALSALVGRAFGETPVVDADGRVCGVITLEALRAVMRREVKERES